MDRRFLGTVPLSKVVKASIIDTYGDIGQVQERHSHWAARGIAKLQRQSLRTLGKRKALLPVSKNTLSAALPIDYKAILFVGVITDDGRKIPLTIDSKLVHIESIQEGALPFCEDCGQDKNICRDLYISEERNLIEIDGVPYEEEVTKKLYPNGNFYIEKLTPVKDLETGLVTMQPSKDFVTNLELKGCGCLDNNASNLSNLQQHCPETFACHYATCAPCEPLNYGGYRIFEEEGFIGVSQNYPYDFIYIEYTGFLPKENGQYLVPEVAFETLVNYVKFKSMENKKGVSAYDKEWYFRQYKREMDNMDIVLRRISISQIIHAISQTPRFGVTSDWYNCFHNTKQHAL